MIECPLCKIETDENTLTTDPEYGICCYECYCEFQEGREEVKDFLRKLKKEVDEDLCPYCGATPYATGCQNCPPCNR